MNLSTPPKHRYSRLILLILSGFAAGVCVMLLYPSVHPLGGLRLDSSEKDVRQSTHRILSALGLDSVRHDLRIGLVSDADLLKRTYTRHGISGGNRELRRHIPAHAWNVQVLKREGESSAIHFGSQPDEQEIRRMIHGDIGMRFDMDEKLLQYAMPVTDSLVLPSLSPQEAYEHMRRILLGHTRPAILGPLAAVAELPDSLQGAFSFRGIRYAGTEKPERKDHVFSWTVCDAALADSVDVAVTVAGNLPVSLTSTYRSMASGDGDEDTSLAEIFEVVLYIALGILLAVAGFRRMRAYEIGFRSAMVISTLGGILFGIWIMMQVSHQMDNMAMLLLVLLASTTFVWAGFVVLWAVSESVGRETWKEKFISFDLLTSGHLLHARLGMSLLTGLVAGAVLLLVALCASWLIGTWHPVWLLERSSDGMSYLTAPSPALFLLGESVIANLAGAAFFIIFFVSFLRPYIRQPLLLALAAAVPLTLIDIPNLVPLPEAWGVLLPVLFLLVLLFILSDVITTLTAMITLSVLQEGMVFLLPGNSAYYSDGILLLAGAGALILYGIATLATKDRVVDFERIAPRFQRHISERQRLSRELEIARDVQMSFLPKKEPVVEGLDIASHCVPAHEVGGDYYDFMELSPGKLGVVIGDVSGKGTQAAFY
ncbi:MAG: hypothetical protein JXA28_14465, partial [Bacteroidetes bacterium]|nr:hypothetical protein [Bacteroidota bacterium]